MKTIKMTKINGAWSCATVYSARILKSLGFQYTSGFLSITVLTNDLKQFNVKVDLL